MQRSHYRQINMPPLPPAQAAILLQDHFGNDPSLALLSRNIIERAQGNPFFLEELVNALVERGDFEGEKGAYRLKGGIDTIPLPTTVQAVVAARIDRLEENAKKVLEIASVVGREISISILDLVTGLTPAELSEAVQHLRQAELLYDVPPFRTAACLHFVIRLSRRLPIDRYCTNVAANFIQKWRRQLKVSSRIMPRSEPLSWHITWSRPVKISKRLNRICALRFGLARTIQVRH